MLPSFTLGVPPHGAKLKRIWGSEKWIDFQFNGLTKMSIVFGKIEINGSVPQNKSRILHYLLSRFRYKLLEYGSLILPHKHLKLKRSILIPGTTRRPILLALWIPKRIQIRWSGLHCAHSNPGRHCMVNQASHPSCGLDLFNPW